MRKGTGRNSRKNYTLTKAKANNMLIEETKTKYGFTTRRYIRDKWTEWFVMDIEKGGYMPFYLPVKFNYMNQCSTAWIWYLIPVVIPLFLIRELAYHVYKETRRILNEWIKYNNINK